MEGWGGTWQRMTRTKQVATDAMDTPLNRCLSTLDITLLGEAFAVLFSRLMNHVRGQRDVHGD